MILLFVENDGHGREVSLRSAHGDLIISATSLWTHANRDSRPQRYKSPEGSAEIAEALWGELGVMGRFSHCRFTHCVSPACNWAKPPVVPPIQTLPSAAAWTNGNS